MTMLEDGVWRNGQMIMNPAFFNNIGDRRGQSLQLMEEIYSVPVDSQVVVADLLAKENKSLTPQMFYEASKTGHALVDKAILESGNVAIKRSRNMWGDEVSEYKNTREEEVFALTDAEEMTEGVKKWLDEFQGEALQLMFSAAVGGHKHIIEHLLEIGVSATSDTPSFTFPLNAACFNGNLECAKLLLASGLDVNSRDEAGGTPLMRAAVGGNTDIVRWLLANGADPQLRETQRGIWNALEFGAGRDVEITKMLLEPCGWSVAALKAAACYAQLESFELIKQAASFPDPVTIVDRTSWMDNLSGSHREAILGSIEQGGAGGSVDILRILLSFIPSEIAKDEEVAETVKNAVRRAARANNSEAVKLLLLFLQDHTFEETAFNELASDLLMDAAPFNAIETTKLLIDNFGADVNHLEKSQNMSPLHGAVAEGHLEMIELLIRDYQANIHRGGGKHANGPTPMWYAVHSQLEHATRLMLNLSGPVESIDPAIVEGVTKKVFVSAEATYRAPVRLLANMDPTWDDQGSTDRFLCLEYPDGWTGGVQIRRSDEGLKDFRGLRLSEDSGFVMI